MYADLGAVVAAGVRLGVMAADRESCMSAVEKLN